MEYKFIIALGFLTQGVIISLIAYIWHRVSLKSYINVIAFVFSYITSRGLDIDYNLYCEEKYKENEHKR